MAEFGPNWRRVHPLTPLLKTWGGLAALLTYFLWQSADLETLSELPAEVAGQMWLVVGAVLGLIALLAAFSVVAWRFTAYAVDTDADGTGSVYFREGIVFRKQRQARLARIQAVDIKRSLLARLFGLSQLTCEVAGGANSAVTIGFLRADDARALREEILTLAGQYRAAEDASADIAASESIPVPEIPRGRHVAQAIPADVGEVAASAPDAALGGQIAEPATERPLYRVPTPRLVTSALLSTSGVIAVLTVLVVIGVLIAALAAGPSGGELFAVLQGGALVSLIPILAGVFWGVIQQVNRNLDFHASLAPDGVRLKRGLTETRAQTIPPARIQAVSMYQPLFWRHFDWWRVTMTVAGYGRESDTESRSVLLPVGTRQEAFTALWSVLPELGTHTPELLINEGMDGFATGSGRDAFVGSPRRSWPLDPISWQRRGFATTANALLMRSGRLNRRLDVVPRTRTQSIALHQGPIQRSLGVATIAAHVPPGPVVPIAQHLDAAIAAEMLAEITAP